MARQISGPVLPALEDVPNSGKVLFDTKITSNKIIEDHIKSLIEEETEESCPNCGDNKLWSNLTKTWTCCYQNCYAGSSHPVKKTEFCPNCLDCATHCTCGTCSNEVCDEQTNNECGHCNGCCNCYTCDHCHVTVTDDEVCSCCSKCDNCCCCSFCEACDDKVTHGCGDCDLCDSHCTCESEEEESSYMTSECPFTPVTRRADIDLAFYKKHDPAQAMAEFYLLSYADVAEDGPTDYLNAVKAAAELCKAEKQKLIEKWDVIFQQYVDMAVGGELRHHQAVAPVLNGTRENSWTQWPIIRETHGPEALKTASSLFMEFRDRAIGGKRWAAAANILYDRITGRIPDWLFVDRVFTMQHNGGSLLNKVSWKFSTLTAYHQLNTCLLIGQAHARDDPDLGYLLLLSRPIIKSTFLGWWKARNRLLVAKGERPRIFPFPRLQQISYNTFWSTQTQQVLAGKKKSWKDAKSIATFPRQLAFEDLPPWFNTSSSGENGIYSYRCSDPDCCVCTSGVISENLKVLQPQ